MSTAWLQTRNNAHDVLAADVLAGDATIEVTTAATQFPVAYPYRVTIWDAVTYTDPGDDPGMEIVQVTGRAGNVLNVTRAQEGTAAAAHTTGDVVRLLVTAGMVQQVQGTIDAHDHSAGGDGAQIAHGSLGSAGSNTHAQIDTHIGSTGNPHSVTAAQAGAATTGDLSAHVGDTGNPHAVSAAQTGAATTGDLSAHTGAANPHSGSASTGDLSAHVGNVANPHAVSAAQVGAATAQWNASQVQGTAVDAAAIGAGKILKYDGTKLVYAADNDTTDHGALSGLGDDDHTQYHTDGRALTWLGTRSTTDLPEGTGLYHTTARARAAVSASTPLAYDSATGVFSIQQATALQAGYLSAADWTTFNAKQAALALPLTHENGGLEADVSAYAGLLKISGGVTSAVTDNSAAWDAAAGLAHAAVTVADSTSVDLTLTGQQVSADVIAGGVDHNSLLNYSADRHFLQTAIDHVSTGFATGLLKVTTGTGALSVAEASDLPTHATRHESGGSDQVNHDSLTGFVANEHIDWTNASNNLLTSGTGQLARMGVGCVPAAGTTQCVKETFTTPDADGNGVNVQAILAPSGALSTTTRIRALRFDARWNSAVDGGTYGTVYGMEGLAQTLSTASGNLMRASGVRGAVTHYGSGNVAMADVVYSLLDNNDEANETGDITAGYNYIAACATDKGTGVIGTRYGYYAEDITGGGLCTTQYGLYVASLAGATTNRAVWLAGTGSSNGIWMGEDTNLFRNAANVLKTEDALVAALNIGAGTDAPAPPYGSDRCIQVTGASSPGFIIDDTGQTSKWGWYALGTDRCDFRYGNAANPILTLDGANARVGVNTATPAVALDIVGGLTVTSTTRAFIPPRMTTAQRDAIASPSAGMVIYNSTTNVLNFYNGSGWGAV